MGDEEEDEQNHGRALLGEELLGGARVIVPSRTVDAQLAASEVAPAPVPTLPLDRLTRPVVAPLSRAELSTRLGDGAVGAMDNIDAAVRVRATARTKDPSLMISMRAMGADHADITSVGLYIPEHDH